MGRLTKAHGLKGAIKLELYTDEPERRFVPGAVFTLQVPTGSPWHGKTIELDELKWYNGHPVAFFKDVPDRTVAETLVKAILWVDHDPAEPSTENAWYDHQLIGLSVLRDGAPIGTISAIDHLPAQDLLTVTTGTGDVLVPFVSAIVPTVDIEAGTLTVTPPPGLFEEVPEGPASIEPDSIEPDSTEPDSPEPDSTE
ncbi:ribosome maturation factor RimM [Parafrigoribacterium mesophilum]|uniref:ribosome maturation factor RimM n=1 Tax=Parafrigoribacterium mesophilum TaxID=433646 RepID=UPI003D15914E